MDEREEQLLSAFDEYLKVYGFSKDFFKNIISLFRNVDYESYCHTGISCFDEKIYCKTIDFLLKE